VDEKDFYTAEEVRSILDAELQASGGQKRWAAKVGARSQDVNNFIHGRRWPMKIILNSLGFERVVLFQRNDHGASGSVSNRLLSQEQVAELTAAAVAKAGSQSEWARQVVARQSDVSAMIGTRRMPSTQILKALGLQKVFFYRRLSC